MENVSSDLIAIIWLAFAAVGIGLLIAGATKKVVVYYDGADMAVSAFGVFLPVVALWMFSLTPFESTVFNWMFVSGLTLTAYPAFECRAITPA